MIHLASRLRIARALLLQAAGVMAAFGVQAQQVDSRIELQELQTTLSVAHAKIQDLERQLAVAKEQNNALAKGSAASSAEAGQVKESYEKLRGLLEGLGIGALENSRDEVQERLLTALSDLRIVDEQKQKLSEALINLAEACMLFAKTASGGDPEARKALDDALAKTDAVVREASVQGTGPARDLHDARVVSLKEEMNVAVLDVGSRDGVKPGMPFEIYREDKPIAKVLVTEVRRAVSGVVIQELMDNAAPVKVGDRGKINVTF